MVCLFLFVPSIQKYVSGEAANFLENKIGTKVDIGGLYLNFPNGVSVEKLYLEDQQDDTLLYSGDFDVSIDYFALLHGEIEISEVNLTNVVANITVNSDSAFNFDYIVSAFVTDSTLKQPTDTAAESALAIDLGVITLNNVRFSYQSDPDGIATAFKVGLLVIDVQNFDLENQVYFANEIKLENTKASFDILKFVESTTTDTSAIQMIVGSKRLIVNKVDFTFNDVPGDLNLIAQIGYLEASAEPINLAEQIVELNSINIQNSLVDFKMKSNIDRIITDEPSSAQAKIWKVSLGDLKTDSLKFIYDDKAYTRLPKQVDFSHINVNIETLAANSIYFNGIQDLGGVITTLNTSEKSGFRLANTNVDFKMTGSSISAQPFQMSTNNSYINAPTNLQFSSLETIADKIGELKINTDFNNSKIGLADLKYFAPEVLDRLPATGLAKQILTVNGQIKGQVNNLLFNQLSIKNQRSTELFINGFIKGLPEMDPLGFDLNKIKLNTTANDLKLILGTSLIPNNINLPKNITLLASAKGNKNKVSTTINLKTTLGNLSAKGLAENLTDTINATYNFTVDMPFFKIGELINDSLFGGLGFKGEIKGKGLTPKSVNVDLDAQVMDFNYLNYNYADLVINGNYQQETFDGEISMNDTNLIFAFNGVARFDSILPKFDFLLNIEGVDLQHLGFTEDDLRVKGRFDIDIEGNNLDNINGGLDIRDVLIIKNQKQYPIDSLLFISIIDTAKTDISIKSNLFDASLKGKIKLSELGTTFQNHFNQYLGFKKNDDPTITQNFKFHIKLHDPDLLTDVILPDLSHFQTGDINGEFDSQESKLDFNVYFSSINYANILIDSLSFISKSNAEKMEANLRVRKVAFDTLGLENISFTNTLANDSLVSYFNIKDDSLESQFQLAGGLTKFNEGYRFKFFENEQVIDFENWKVDPKNEIIIDEETIINNVNFSNKKQHINLQTAGDYLDFTAENFELENIFNLIQNSNEKATEFGLFLKDATEKAKAQSNRLANDSSASLLTGILNANARIPQTNEGSLSGKADIREIEVNGITVGNLKAEATSTSNRTDLNASLKGNGNSLSITGLMTEENMNFEFDIEKIQLKTIEAFSNGQLKNSSGFLSGNGNFVSEAEKTNINGALNFKNIQFKSTYLGEEYHFQDERLTFNGDKLTFERFTVLDSADRPFKVSGNVYVDDLTNPKFDLKITSKNFQFLNTTKEDENDLFYGSVFITSEVKIKGTGKKPIVNANVKLNKGTDITFVVPNTEEASVNHDGIVKFVDKDNGLPALLREQKYIDTIRTDFKGVDLTAFLEIDEETKVTMVIDPITGDRLLVRGGGKIRTNVDLAGNVSMNGIYQIKEGNYELRLYNLVRRKFDLVPGGQLIWNGDPLEATMDIKGTYVAKAAPIGLLGSQISNLNASELLQYKRKLPFEVILNIGGKLLQPEISFKLDLPEDDKGALGGVVIAKLTEINQDESELNKQVFALIVLKRFIDQDPFASGGGGSNTARQSVSQLLNQQLNSLTDKYVKGVEIELNVDSYEDYNSNGDLQGRTDLNVALSKQFFNERVKVRVNGDFGVENQSSNTSGIAGDIAVEYKVTEDGRYRLKLYRDNKYAGFIEGQLIETGVALIFTREYELFRNLFKKPKTQEVKDE